MEYEYYYGDFDFSKLIGETIISIRKTIDELEFRFKSGKEVIFYHSQDCCESVTIDDVIGDLNCLIGKPLVMAEEIISTEKNGNEPEYYESFTWTFYKFANINGYVTVRWFGDSNGYYSETVDIKTKGF